MKKCQTYPIDVMKKKTVSSQNYFDQFLPIELLEEYIDSNTKIVQHVYSSIKSMNKCYYGRSYTKLSYIQTVITYWWWVK